MKKLGLIGGIGPESTIPYYRDIVYGVQAKVGENFFPNLTIESVNVFDVLNMCAHKEYGKLIDYLMTAINNLIKCDVDFIAMTGNTPHIVFDELQKCSSVPLVSIVDATCNETNKNKITKVGLLGTLFTMEGTFFQKPFVAKNIDVITPTTAEQKAINHKISTELELGIFTEETRRQFLQIIQRMKEQDGIEAIILGCTELPLLFNDIVLPLQSLDTMQIHIKMIIDMIVS